MGWFKSALLWLFHQNCRSRLSHTSRRVPLVLTCRTKQAPEASEAPTYLERMICLYLECIYIVGMGGSPERVIPSLSSIMDDGWWIADDGWWKADWWRMTDDGWWWMIHYQPSIIRHESSTSDLSSVIHHPSLLIHRQSSSWHFEAFIFMTLVLQPLWNLLPSPPTFKFI